MATEALYRTLALAVPPMVALAAAVGCGDSSDDSGYNELGAVATATSGSGAVGGGTTTTAGVPVDEPPPEREIESSFREPVATGRYLWSANPETGRIAIIDTTGLSIQLTDAGFGPTFLAALPSDTPDVEQAIVINVLSHDATLLGIGPTGDISTRAVPIHVAANSWAIAPSGHWAVAWTDARSLDNPDPTDGFQDISVIETGSGSVTRLSVGYRPSQIVFDTDEQHLFVVTEPGISVIDLQARPSPETQSFVDLGSDGEPDSTVRDVNISAAAGLALVRREASPLIGVVPLDGSEPSSLEMSAPVTDLDLSRDGTRAVAVMRAQSEVGIIDVSALGTAEELQTLQLPGGLFGSVALSPLAEVAVLYTNAIATDQVTLLSLEAGDGFLSHRTVNVKSPVQAVFVAPDAEHAIALLDVPAGSSKHGAFSLLSTKSERAPKIVGTDAAPFRVALPAESPSVHALVTCRDDQNAVFQAHIVNLESLQVDTFDLASPPLATGVLQGGELGYVAQAHPEGRITFIDLGQRQVQTLTGFELAAKVVD